MNVKNQQNVHLYRFNKLNYLILTLLFLNFISLYWKKYNNKYKRDEVHDITYIEQYSKNLTSIL